MTKLSFPTIKLGKYIKEVKGKVKNTNLNQDDLIVYGVTNTDGIIVTNNKASDDLSNYTVLNENQFAYNPYRVNVGSIGLSAAGTFGVVSPAYVVFEATKEISSEFLLYYLKSDLGINLIKWYGDRGGVRSSLRFVDLKEIDFPDIDLGQQLEILKTVKQIDGKLFEFNSNLSLENISSLRQAILQQAVEGKLCKQDPTDEPASVLLEKIKAEKEKLIAEKKIKKQKELPPITEKEKPFALPQGWEWCRFVDIIEISSNLVKPAEYLESIHLAPDNIEKNTGKLLPCNTVFEDDVKSYNHLFFEGQIVYSKIRPALRKVVIAPFNGLCSADMYPLDVFCDNRYIHKYLLTNTFTEQVLSSDNRVKMPKTNQSELSKVVIPLPPLLEQQRIVEKVDRLIALCDELEQEVANAKKYASQLMEAVLQEAFNTKTQPKKNNVIRFTAAQPPVAQSLMAAARGNMREDTWDRITNEAVKLASEES